MSRIINRLVEESGGWERFLYGTLTGLCNEIDPTDIGERLGEAYAEAMEILEAYEETGKKGVQPNQVISTPQVQKVAENHSTPEPKVGRSVQVDKPKPQPERLHVQVWIDKDVGASHGELPLPAGFQVVNREALIVTTRGGVELGRGSADGQVRGIGASGQVTLSGTYRLVFKDTNLGTGLIHFEAAPAPSTTPAPVLKPGPVAQPVQPAPELKLEEK